MAYLLVWTWQEHRFAMKVQHRGEPDQRLVLLVDEPEMHLHPRWQRTILPALLRAAAGMRTMGAEIQILTATHSPLVLVSLETSFDAERDAWLDLDRVPSAGESHVELHRRTFVRRGDVSNWLTSEAFDLKQARSLEAEEAITQARALLREEAPSKTEVERVDQLLQASLGDIDRFWVRWSAWKDARKGGE
jgi:AAA domain, putative AbiEii toxin, Type IV TA system